LRVARAHRTREIENLKENHARAIAVPGFVDLCFAVDVAHDLQFDRAQRRVGRVMP
jgi:hypothetical protein